VRIETVHRGKTADALKTLGELKDQSKHSHVPPYHLAVVQAGLGENESAFAWLERAFEKHAVDLFTLNVEPVFDSLRSDPRFANLLRRVVSSLERKLVDVDDGSQLWGEQYQRAMADIFELQEEISGQISAALRLKVSGAQKKRLMKRPTKNTEAYDLYLKGRFFWNKRTREDANRGMECFQQPSHSIQTLPWRTPDWPTARYY
jgi:hypothetical protein